MKPINENEKLSISECRKILSSTGKNYSDEEILKIRNWLYKFCEITFAFLERKSEEDILELKNQLSKKKNSDNKI